MSNRGRAAVGCVLGLLAIGRLRAADDSGRDRLVAALVGATPLADDLEALSDRVGGRPTGSDANRRAVDWAMARLADAGVAARARALRGRRSVARALRPRRSARRRPVVRPADRGDAVFDLHAGRRHVGAARGRRARRRGGLHAARRDGPRRVPARRAGPAGRRRRPVPRIQRDSGPRAAGTRGRRGGRRLRELARVRPAVSAQRRRRRGQSPAHGRDRARGRDARDAAAAPRRAAHAHGLDRRRRLDDRERRERRRGDPAARVIPTRSC